MSGLLVGGVAVVAGGLGLSGELGARPPAYRTAAATAPVGAPAATAATTSRIPAVATAAPTAAPRPVTLQIPSIAVNGPMELLGLATDGTLQTPTDPMKAGWYTGSSLPGEPGPVVIAGHVDSYTGPAVFAHLKNLRAGDRITLTLSGGSRVVYRVTSVVAYAKDKFPTQSVYGPRPDSELRLITCGGDFVQGHYVDNVIVFAALSG